MSKCRDVAYRVTREFFQYYKYLKKHQFYFANFDSEFRNGLIFTLQLKTVHLLVS